MSKQLARRIPKRDLGKKIKVLRCELGMTMHEFGQLFQPSASDSIVSRWERGISIPNENRINKLIDLGLDLEDDDKRFQCERLEEVKRTSQYHQNGLEKVTLYADDFDWLIEQAEQNKKLKQERDKWRAMVDKLAGEGRLLEGVN